MAVLLSLVLTAAIGVPIAEGQVYLPTSYERVLVPVIFVLPRTTAFGSMWMTVVNIHNSSSERVQVLFNPPQCNIPTCPAPPVTFAQPGVTHLATSFFFFENNRVPENTGAIFRVERSRTNDIHFGARLHELSRRLNTWGTEIPVVREPDFIRGRNVVLLDAPKSTEFRMTLRIFDLNGMGSGFRVRYVDRDGIRLHETVVTLKPNDDPVTRGFERFPGYFQTTDFSSVHSERERDGRFRVEIEPLDPSAEYWTFLTVTHNETQHVTFITPQ